MAFRVTWSASARRDLRAISDYYFEQASKSVARSVVQSIEGQVDLIGQMPLAFPVYEPSLDESIRQSVIKTYRIFYEVDRDRSQIRILHVRHSSRQEPTL